MIQVHSLAFGTFAEAEPLNPLFANGHPKIRITVDAEPDPSLPDREILSRLEEAFPGLSRHQCRASAKDTTRADGVGVLLIKGQSSANQAHILEHLLLEILMALNGKRRLSGVTCAYRTPPERNDIFVECAEARAGSHVLALAVEALNATLAGDPLAPRYPDAVLCLGLLLRAKSSGIWSPATFARGAEISASRAAGALEILSGIGIVQAETYAINFSGEPFYRLAEAPECCNALRQTDRAPRHPYAHPLVAPQFKQE